MTVAIAAPDAAPAAPAVTPAARPAVRFHEAGVTLRIRRRRTEVLRGVNLAVAPGEFVAIVGRSGCGKSTLISAAAGFARPSAGTVHVSSRSVAVMFQTPSLFDWLTVSGNVELALRLRGVHRRDRRPRALELLGSMGIAAMADRRIHELSGGQRQRAALARCLAQQPDVLLMDEPFAALDEVTQAQLHEELLTLWQRTGTTVLLVTHDVGEAVRLAQRVVLVAGTPGRPVAQWSVPRPGQPGGRAELVREIAEALAATVDDGAPR